MMTLQGDHRFGIAEILTNDLAINKDVIKVHGF